MGIILGANRSDGKKNWKLKEEGKNVKGERLEIELPSEVQEIPF